MNQVRIFPQQSFPFRQRFSYQSELSVFQIPQSTMNDSCRTARGSRSEVSLFDEKRASSRASALSRYRNPVDPAANHDQLELPGFQGGPGRVE
jgi:hypothetical protein